MEFQIWILKDWILNSYFNTNFQNSIEITKAVVMEVVKIGGLGTYRSSVMPYIAQMKGLRRNEDAIKKCRWYLKQLIQTISQLLPKETDILK